MISFIADESAASAAEYAVIAGLISIIILLSVTDIGVHVLNLFSSIANAF